MSWWVLSWDTACEREFLSGRLVPPPPEGPRWRTPEDYAGCVPGGGCHGPAPWPCPESPILRSQQHVPVGRWEGHSALTKELGDALLSVHFSPFTNNLTPYRGFEGAVRF